ncbi:hypothetical protein [Sulfuracidifex metallicus]|uniref:hypothetical protein n=1 Tax=Sulfuracidifex metallicus TaxID=47303 RepID=UPI002274A022|nr:hypothetical protein [Sulfuracidifex metallicus]MCY0851039.1 hypothetical protein [Sulfuracidifex metallicus]
MGITVEIQFQNQYGEPVPESGTVTITQNASAICWTGLNQKFTFSSQATWDFVTNSIGSSFLGTCPDIHVHYETDSGLKGAFTLTPADNGQTVQYTVNVETASQSSLSQTWNEISSQIEAWVSDIYLDMLIIIVVIIVFFFIYKETSAVGNIAQGPKGLVNVGIGTGRGRKR